MQHSFKIHSFRFTQPYLIVGVLATQAEFLEIFCYCTEMNWAFILHTAYAFGCFYSVMAQFELIKYKFNNIAHLSAWVSNYAQSEVMQNMSAHQILWYYQPLWVHFIIWTILVPWYMHHKVAHIQISQYFWLTRVFWLWMNLQYNCSVIEWKTTKSIG